ncbi:CUGBP Elav-like family member 3-A isoform X2 [Corticium candelabrum]|uniref:CUGBP Elav-like family member 3-A isoform X2 n=1 Tax=Corticium candelabrum TaxID=121492 RepID=UPI002E271B94|nr:CUGBP Elav-like family member 3-A isoform X2 [Corticium candelabrum]
MAVDALGLNGEPYGDLREAMPYKDPDSVKLFIGQVPRSFTESDLRPFVEEFGPIHELSILRDKSTGESKGCAFLTYCSRDSAIKAQTCLHDRKTLPGGNHAMQVRPADSLKKGESGRDWATTTYASPMYYDGILRSNEPKLFIGMLSRTAGEDEVRHMCRPYGSIESVTVLRDGQGKSKGCAFLTFGTRAEAIRAISALNHSTTMEGCNSPLVVKFADTEKERQQKRMRDGGMAAPSALGMGMAIPGGVFGPYGAAAYQQQMNPALALSMLGGNAGLGLASLSASLAAQQQQQQIGQPQQPQVQQQQPLTSIAGQQVQRGQPAVGTMGSVMSGTMGGMTSSMSSVPGAASVTGVGTMAGLGNIAGMGNVAGMTGMGLGGDLFTGMTSPAAATSGVTPEALSQAFGGMGQFGAFQGGFQPVFQQFNRIPQKEGPDGSNLFIYHLPQEWGDLDLFQLFMNYGNVVSAKVFVDKNTQLSKCFGFVSYDNPVSAATAIQALNGFQINQKRLKVQLKRPKDANKPY